MNALGYPWFLGLLTLVPALAAVYYWTNQRRKRARSEFASSAMIDRLGFVRPTWKAFIAPALLMTAVALASIAMARPLGPPTDEGDKSAGMDVIIALDVSDSMAVTDVSGARLGMAKEFITRLTEIAPDNRYGLVVFSGDAVITCPPTMDIDAFLNFITDADFNRTNLPGTNLAEAMQAAAKFKKSELPRAVVIVSDGENTYGPDPVKAAGDARGANMKVFAVGVGTSSGGNIPSDVDFFGKPTWKLDKQGRVVLSRLDDKALGNIARAGGGSYFSGSDIGSVKSLARQFEVHDKKAMKDPFQGAAEYGPWFALAAAAVVGIAIML